ncbi:uncharacterized protein [Littorina saxatilis]|uniref:Reverse transcriptase n=1 Tax=Littorina saxatilis TaxID=31220 RepID=A0AAN9FZE0_9CAEN
MAGRRGRNRQDDDEVDQDVSLSKFLKDGRLLGLTGKNLGDYAEKRRQEYEEEKRRKEELERQERERREEEARKASKEERKAKERREEEERKARIQLKTLAMQQDFEMRKIREMAELGLNVNQNANQGDRESAKKIDIKLPFLDDKDDVEVFLRQYERIAKLLEWEDKEKAIRLAGQLKGQARQVYTELSDEDAVKFDVVKSAILRRFQLTAEAYRKKFRDFKRKSHENVRECKLRMSMYLDRWIELSEKEGRSGDLKDLILSDKLMDTFSPDQARFVRERVPKNLNEVLLHAQTFEDAREAEGRGHNKRFGTGGDGHGPKQKVENKSSVSMPQNQGGKPIGQKNTVDSNPRPSRPDRKCYRSGGPHLIRDCPKMEKQGGNQASSVVGAVQAPRKGESCQRCREDFEPMCQLKVGGKTVIGMRDTGANCILVDSKLVPKERYLGQYQNLTLADSSNRKIPIAEVELETPFFSGLTRVLVVKTLIHPVLIGNYRITAEEEKLNVPVFPTMEVKMTSPEAAPVQTRLQEEKAKRGAEPWLPKQVDLGQIRPKDLSRKQKNDPSLEKIRDRAGKGPQDGTHYEWRKEILYRVYMSEGSSCKQVVVPECYRSYVLKLAHDSAMAGHQGVRRTRDRVWRDFYWPGICGDIRRYCASCDACQRSTKKGATKKVPLKKMPLIRTPFERIGVDIVGPIVPASNRGHRYVLTVVDYATRYVEATSLKDIKAETIADALFVIWTRLGIPKEILTDQGGQFMGEVMSQLNKLLNVKGIRTSPWHPQTNGLTEKFNQTLKSMLKRLCQEQPKDWDQFLPALLFAYRETPQESLKFSPFELLFGREVRGPMQVLRQVWTSEDVEEEARSTVSHIVDLTNKIAKTCEIARDNLSKAAIRYAKAYDKKTKERYFAAGDKVLMLLPEKRNKLQLTWRGPYLVLDRIGGCNYKVKVKDQEKILHANLLKLYVDRETDGSGKQTTPVCDAKQEDTQEACVVVDEVQEEKMGGLGIDCFPMLSLQPKEGPSDVKINPDLAPQKKAELQAICGNRVKALSDIPGHCVLEECELKLKSTEPVHVKPYPLPFAQVETVKKEVDDMLKLGVIEPSVSPYNSPIVLVKKKDGTIRFCIDYRRLNKELEFDSEPIPDVPTIFAKLKKKRYLSKIDLSKGYWQIGVKESDRPKTSFSTPAGEFQWKRLPFGLKTSGAVFTRMMRKLLEPMKSDDVEHFIDDIIVATETWEQHVEAVDAVLKRLEEVGLTAKPSKCYLGYSELDYLGHHVGQGMIMPDEDKIQKIRDANRPVTKKEVRAFLGLVGYYRRFVDNYAEISAPLTDLTKGGQPEKVKWNDECEAAFIKLKEKLISKPVLLLPDPSKPFVLRTDASDIAVGAVLMQDQGQGLQPLAYASKKLSKAEKNYSVIEKECLGVVWAVKKYEQYLYSVHFTLETDHQPLTYLQKTKTENGRLMRWAMQLQQYSFTVKVIPGKDNVGADYMSRIHE